MNMTGNPRIVRLRRVLLLAAILGGIVAIVLGILVPAAVLPACRFALFACLAPAIGSLLFALIYRLTAGQWGESLESFLFAGSRLAPWILIGALPLLFFAPATGSQWPHYESRAMIGLRSACCVLVMFMVAVRLGLAPKSRGALGAAGLIVLVFTLHVLADDWLTSVEPHWHSTAFPLVWMTGQAVAGLSCAVLAALLCGVSPRVPWSAPRAVGLDWGNLLLAAMLFWCYVMFAQFLIIWAGNLPSEITWFEHRTRGVWSLVPPLLALVHFALPFALLLSRTAKKSSRMLAVVAGVLLLGQVIFIAWLILPAFPTSSLIGEVLPFALLVALASLFFDRYLALAHRREAPA